jgi:hypothetical protein
MKIRITVSRITLATITVPRITAMLWDRGESRRGASRLEPIASNLAPNGSERGGLGKRKMKKERAEV